MAQLYERMYYTAPYSYIRSTFIREYDIQKANINALLSNGIITQKEYDWFCIIPKQQREEYIGKMAKNNKEIKLASIIIDTIKEARRLFIETNGLSESSILSIKNDALYIINDIPTYTDFGNMHFILKNVYTSYYHIQIPRGLEMYYSLDRVNNLEKLDIKGISDGNLEVYHEPFMVDFLKTLFYSIETDPIKDSIELIKAFYTKYINRDLDIEYYRQFGPKSMFDTLFNSPVLKSRYLVNNPLSNQSNLVIDYNASIIRELYKIVCNIYFNETRQ